MSSPAVSRLPHTPSTSDRTKRIYSNASTMHDSAALESSYPFPVFPSPHSHASPTSSWIKTPLSRSKPEDPHPLLTPRDDSKTARASTPDTNRYSPYHPLSCNRKEIPHPVESGRFPGPLRIPPAPRFLASPSPSPHGSPASTLNTPAYRRHSIASGSPSPPPLPSWHDGYLSETLPPIRRPEIHRRSSLQDDLPHLFPARWSGHSPAGLQPSPRFLDTPSPSPSSPESEYVALPRKASTDLGSLPGSPPRYEYPSEVDYSDVVSHGYAGDRRNEPTRRFRSSYLIREENPRRSPLSGPLDLSVEADGHNAKVASVGKRFNPVKDADGGQALVCPSELLEEKRNVSVQTTLPPQQHPLPGCDHTHEPQGQEGRAKYRFGLRKGARFYCSYVSPVTGERCDMWDRGWTVYATLVRHAEVEHAQEEIDMLDRGVLSYDAAQIINSREKRKRIEENMANTGRCPDCGTVFSSKRKDSLSRHKLSSACEKAQKRGRPPTKFPKKPKGPSIQVLQVESTGSSP